MWVAQRPSWTIQVPVPPELNSPYPLIEWLAHHHCNWDVMNFNAAFFVGFRLKARILGYARKRKPRLHSPNSVTNSRSHGGMNP
jgi:hypothetical protein